MMEVLSSLNLAEWAGIIAAVILLAERVSRITPTKSDDKIVQFVRKLFNVLSINVPDVQKVEKKEEKKDEAQ